MVFLRHFLAQAGLRRTPSRNTPFSYSTERQELSKPVVVRALDFYHVDDLFASLHD